MLSIPRDLLVTLPDGSAGRVNTAHFFAEANEPGSGPAAAMNTIRSNFGVDVHRYVRFDLVGFVRIVDALGGVWLDVPEPLIDYEYPTYDYGTRVVSFEAGRQHLDGELALAYARIRHGSSDFARAERQQLVVQALFRRVLSPAAWVRFPLVAAAVADSVDTDLGLIDLARLAPTLLRAGPDGLDRRVIQGSMVEPFTTEGGAAVQLPVWEAINPVLLEMFGQ
jgi:LCP family protein required for cell wall assembly